MKQRALVLVGEGYGNIVMATPLIRAVSLLGYETHVFVDSKWADAHELLADWDAISGLWTNIFDVTLFQWDVVVGSVWRRSNHKIPAKRYVAPERLCLRRHHEAEVNMTAAKKLGWHDPMPEPHCSRGRAPQDLPQNFVAVCPGFGGRTRSFWIRKAWSKWPEFVRHIRTSVILLGGRGEREQWAIHYRGYFGTLTVGEAAAVLKRASYVVAIDNGLAHIAAALGKPTVVLFGATSEIKNRPLGPKVEIVTANIPCRPCQMTDRWDECTDWRCMREISVGDVLKALAKLGFRGYNI